MGLLEPAKHLWVVGLQRVNDCWKQEVDSKVRECSLLSQSYEGSVSNGQIECEEIAKCVRRLKNNKTGGSNGIVGELLKYGRSGMMELLHK